MPELVTTNDAQYAYEIVSKICDEVGPGLPGTSQEWARATIIKEELESHLGRGNVAMEEFVVRPGAFVGAYPMSAALMLVAALMNIWAGRSAAISPLVMAGASLALSILAPLPFLFLFVLNYEWADRFFPKKRSVNVIGALRKPGAENVKCILILSGHHDSAPENTWFRLLGGVKRRLERDGLHDRAWEDVTLRRLGYVFFYGLTMTWILGFVTLMGASALQLVGLIAGNPGLVRFGTLGWILLAYPILPSIIFAMFFTRAGKDGGTVPGAADNLSASALCVALCRLLVNNPSHIPPDTEIRFISFGSEEAGLRGSRRYVERHLAELTRLDARLLNFETVADPVMVILSGEGNGAVQVSQEMVQSVVQAAERARVPYRVQAPWLGAAGDAAPFSGAGLRATTLCPFRMPEQVVDFYHQRWDRPEVLSVEPLLNVLKLALEWVRCGGE